LANAADITQYVAIIYGWTAVNELFLDHGAAKTRVLVNTGLLSHIGEYVREMGPPPVVVVCSDETVAGHYGERLIAQLEQSGLRTRFHKFPAGDASKSLDELDRIYRELADARAGRDALLLALGGGVVSDLTGFAAATWMRGIRYITCPTTLESAVDACVGGKTAINHVAGKNMIGAFHHPSLVAIDPECLKTLPARDIQAGLAESIKHGLIRDADFVDWHEQNRDAVLACDPDVMAALIERNLRIKISVVEQDEREQGLRAFLNFGHTIGHAIEKHANYALRHGEAVALGMVGAAILSEKLECLTHADVERIRDLIASYNLPVTSPVPLDIDTVLQLTQGDKKALAGKRRWVLLKQIGEATLHDDIDDALVREAVMAVSPQAT
jgi:3-dehydroquinate synthase